MERKVDIKIEVLLLGWTAAFLLLLAVLFPWKLTPGVRGERGTAAASVAVETTGPLEVNRATKEELMELPGIGGTLAQRILDYRREHGSFQDPRELLEVSGIGESKYGALQGLITVNGKGIT